MMEMEFRRRFELSNRRMYVKEDYELTLDEVKENRAIMAAGRMVPDDKWSLVRRYDVVTVDGQERLAVPFTVTANHERLRVYAYVEEVFAIIRDCHVSNGHSGCDDVHRRLKVRYQNISLDTVALYVNLCADCKPYNNRWATGSGHDPGAMLSNRSQVDVIDMRSQSDGPFRHYMMYRDLATGFAYLQGLNNDHVDDVTYTVFDLVTTFGVPAVLQSDNGREFAAEIAKRLRTILPGMRLVHGNALLPTADERRPKKTVQRLLAKWMHDHNTSNWCVGLKIVQSMYNSMVHPGHRSTPFDLMFTSRSRVGLVVPQLSADVAAALESEEDVYAALGQCENDYKCESKYDAALDDSETPSTSSAKETTEEITMGKVGDHIKVKLRTNSDRGLLYNIRETQGVILEVKNNLYEIGTDLGRLPKLCNRLQFKICDQKTSSINTSEFPLDKLCAYEITKYYSANAFVCKCLKLCNSYKCICKRMRMPCKSLCHNDSACSNKK